MGFSVSKVHSVSGTDPARSVSRSSFKNQAFANPGSKGFQGLLRSRSVACSAIASGQQYTAGADSTHHGLIRDRK
ncbi:uncharacterized protein EI90DRAFT_3029640 [Cantharellus anzutake]|uniref:uncharacterized protein n=1 Tax=Cantharellus anzutake TaxID=1750568 RepID=UPI0019043D05|nr:uncharacterized protein EI90DRAFT_3029640 [Cantharellus anzutake]KAF8342620.1 hypothetical protein EI90DRAFT_3029640 [Cantharellus anzutake]